MRNPLREAGKECHLLVGVRPGLSVGLLSFHWMPENDEGNSRESFPFQFSCHCNPSSGPELFNVDRLRPSCRFRWTGGSSVMPKVLNATSPHHCSHRQAPQWPFLTHRFDHPSFYPRPPRGPPRSRPVKVRGCERPRVTIDGFKIPTPTLTHPTHRQSHCLAVWNVALSGERGGRAGYAQDHGGRSGTPRQVGWSWPSSRYITPTHQPLNAHCRS